MMIIQCTSQDIHTLAVLNKRLIEDEKSDNPMSPEELEKRTGLNTLATLPYDR